MRFELGTYADAVQTISRNKLGHIALFIAAFWAFIPMAGDPGIMPILFALVWSVIALICLSVTARHVETITGRFGLVLMLGVSVLIICMAAGVLIGVV